MYFRLKFFFLAFLASGLGLQAPGDDLNPGCLPDDNAEPPTCDDYTEQTFIPHPYNCSRFWECEPQRGHCLMDCPPINPSENLYFNPTLNVCDWPENVNCEMSEDCGCEAWQACVSGKCTPDCKQDSHCTAEEYCNAGGNCVKGCRGSEMCGSCGQCVDHVCQEPECCQDSDCQNEFTCVEGICTEPLCSVDADCDQGEYCSTEGCIPGCITGNNCGTCGECVNHICQEPECCQDSDCEDETVCSTANVCVPGCRSSEDCPGWDQICDSSHSTCSYCNQITHQCTQGCDTSTNCGGYACNNNHVCLVGLQSITLKTQSCTGCQGAQGSAKEDGPFIILLGGGGQTCNTKQLDNPDKIDFDNGKIAVFSDPDLLQSCDKADLGNHISGGSVHWTAIQGLWQPAKNQIQINWSDSSVESECCCMTGPSLSSQNRVGSLYTCTKCSSHPGC